MSQTIIRFRSKYPQFGDLTDEVLAYHIGNAAPVYLKEPNFKAEYQRGMQLFQQEQDQAQEKLPDERSFWEISGDAWVGSIYEGQRSLLMDQIMDAGEATPEQTQELARLSTEIQKYPASKEMQKINDPDTGWFEAAKGLADPTVLAELAMSTIPKMFIVGSRKIPKAVGIGAAGGAAIFGAVGAPGGLTGLPAAGFGATVGVRGGFVAGVGLTSLALEGSAKIMETLQEDGVDITSGEQIAMAFADPDNVSRLRTKALEKGIPIAIFDALSAGIAGKLLSKPVKTVGGKAAAAIKEFGIQGALGMGGEAAGEWYAGEQLSPGSILSEGVGEVVAGGPIEIGVGTLGRMTESGLQRMGRTTDTQPLVKPEEATNADVINQERINAGEFGEGGDQIASITQYVNDRLEQGQTMMLRHGDGSLATLGREPSGTIRDPATGKVWSPGGLARTLINEPDANLIFLEDVMLEGVDSLTPQERSNYFGGELVQTPAGVGVRQEQQGIVRNLRTGEMAWHRAREIQPYTGRTEGERASLIAQEQQADAQQKPISVWQSPIADRTIDRPAERGAVTQTFPITQNMLNKAEEVGAFPDVLNGYSEQSQQAIIDRRIDQMLEQRILEDWVMDAERTGMTEQEIEESLRRGGVLNLQRDVRMKQDAQVAERNERIQKEAAKPMQEKADAINASLEEARELGVSERSLSEAKDAQEIQDLIGRRKLEMEQNAAIQAINKDLAANQQEFADTQQAIDEQQRRLERFNLRRLPAAYQPQPTEPEAAGVTTEAGPIGAPPSLPEQELLGKMDELMAQKSLLEELRSINEEFAKEARARTEAARKKMAKARNAGHRSLIRKRAKILDDLAEARRQRVLAQVQEGSAQGVTSTLQQINKELSQFHSGIPVKEALKKLGLTEAQAARIIGRTLPKDSGDLTKTERNELVQAAMDKTKFMRKAARGFQKFVDVTMPKPYEDVGYTFDEEHGMLPRITSWDDFKKYVSQPYGLGRIPIVGKVFDRRFGARNPFQQATAAWWHGVEGFSKGMGGAFRSFVQGITSSFEIDPTTKEITNIEPNPEVEGSADFSMKYADVFENLMEDPDAYILSARQRDQFNEVVRVLNDIKQLQRDMGVRGTLDGEAYANDAAMSQLLLFPEEAEQIDNYFPHAVIKNPRAPTRPPVGKTIGEKPFFQKSRWFDTMDAGMAAGYDYVPTVEDALAVLVERTYKSAFDKLFITDPSLGGVPRSQFVKEFKARNRHRVKKGQWTEADLNEKAQAEAHKYHVDQPGLANMVYTDEEIVKALNHLFPKAPSRIRKAFAELNSVIKAFTLGVDLGVMFNQGLIMSFTRPDIWASATAKSIQAIGDPKGEAFGAFLKRPDVQKAVLEMVQMGSTIGQLPEMMMGLRSRWLRRLPGARHGFAAFERQLTHWFDYAKINLYMAWRETVPANERMDLIQGIEALIGLGRMESIGVTGAYALAERTFLLAPSYYRGFGNLIAGLVNKRAGGAVARRAMVRYLTAGPVLYYAVGAGLLDMDDDELSKRLNPSRGDFLTWDVKTGDPDRPIVQVSLGGISKSVMRLIGNLYVVSGRDPGALLTADTQRNPVAKWYRGHSGPTVGALWNLGLSEDYIGRTYDLTDIPKKTMFPLWAQEWMEGATPSEVGLSVLGVQSWESSNRKRFSTLRKALAKEAFGREFEDLSFMDQLRVNNTAQNTPPFNQQLPEERTPVQQRRAEQEKIFRQQALESKLSEANQKWMKDRNYRVPGYDTSWVIRGTDYWLNEKDQKKYQDLIAEEYDKVINMWRETDPYRNLSPARAQKHISRVLSNSRMTARARLIYEERVPYGSYRQKIPLSNALDNLRLSGLTPSEP